MGGEDDSKQPPPWLRGAMISSIGVVIGAAALVCFCYALGLNFSDEGWSGEQPQWKTNRTELIVSLLGFGVAILVFWIGFFRTTHSHR